MLEEVYRSIVDECNERRKFGSGKNAVTEMNVEGGRQRPKKKKKKK